MKKPFYHLNKLVRHKLAPDKIRYGVICLMAMLLSHPVMAGTRLTVKATPHETRLEEAMQPFTKLSAPDIGITYHNALNPTQFIEPFYMGRGITSGDIDNDGWVDVAVATNNGFSLYRNQKGERFEEVMPSIEGLQDKQSFGIALVDMNNDGWLDIYLTTFATGNYVVPGPLLGEKTPIPLAIANDPALVTLGLAFADINKDGFLDIAQGNWSGGNIFRTPGNIAQNHIVFNRNMTFESVKLDEVYGQTFSTLLSDFTNDGITDLVMANDFDPPDMFYVGREDGVFNVLSQQDKVIPTSPNLSMGASTGDFNNDLIPDMYLVGVAYDMDTLGIDFMSASRYQGAVNAGDISDKYCDSLDGEEKESCYKVAYLSRYSLVFEINSCNFPPNLKVKLGEDVEKSCLVFKLLDQAALRRDASLCKKLPEGYLYHNITCERITSSSVAEKWDSSVQIPQKKNANILLQGSKEGAFTNVAEKMGAQFGAWGWNARFVDLDNDSWQDIFLVNGSPYDASFRMFGRDSNIFFHNLDGKNFAREQAFFGLENFAHTTAYTTIDYDNDGDLDILTNTDYGTYTLYKNNDISGRSITFSLDDAQGNRKGIGTKIRIYYGDNEELHQMRELIAGGGYLSSDAPRIHFGLGKHESVQRIEILWPTGKKDIIEHPLEAGKHYHITRAQ